MGDKRSFNWKLFKKQLKKESGEVINSHQETIISKFDELFKLIIKNDYSREYYSLRDVMDWFSEKQKEYPSANKGVLILVENNLKGAVLILSLLDANTQPFVVNNECVASKIITKELDPDILEQLGESEMIIFE